MRIVEARTTFRFWTCFPKQQHGALRGMTRDALRRLGRVVCDVHAYQPQPAPHSQLSSALALLCWPDLTRDGRLFLSPTLSSHRSEGAQTLSTGVVQGQNHPDVRNSPLARLDECQRQGIHRNCVSNIVRPAKETCRWSPFASNRRYNCRVKPETGRPLGIGIGCCETRAADPQAFWPVLWT